MGGAFDYLVYLALRAAWAAARRVPPDTLRRVLEGAAVLVYRLDAHHRRITLRNLSRAFPEWSEQRRVAAARDAFRAWGRIAAELVHTDHLACGETLESIHLLQRKADELGAGGRGVLALTAHTGNFELLARLLGKVGSRRVVVFHRRMANRFVEEFLLRQREAMNVATLGRGIVVREALRVLARGDILVVPLDQNQSRKRGVFVEFFGRPACTSTMLARLSLATGLTVQPAFAVWNGNELVAELGEPIIPPASLPAQARARVVAELTQRYTREVERAVRQHPTQWNWAHRRWKTRPTKPVLDAPPGTQADL